MWTLKEGSDLVQPLMKALGDGQLSKTIDKGFFCCLHFLEASTEDNVTTKRWFHKVVFIPKPKIEKENEGMSLMEW